MTRGGKWLVGIFSGLIIWSQLQLWGDRRVFHIYELYRSNSLSWVENDGLSERNRTLEREIRSMKSGGDESIEKEAREELGMIKRGEIFYRLTDDAFRQAPSQ